MALYFSGCKNSESNSSKEFLDTQVIKSLCATKLVYLWIHLKFLFICAPKISDFYKNIEESHTTLSTWVHMYMSVLHFILSNAFSQRNACRCFSPIIMKKKSVNFLMKSVEIPWYFSSLPLFIFNVLTSKYNFSWIFNLFLISKHNDLFQSEQKIDPIQYHN